MNMFKTLIPGVEIKIEWVLLLKLISRTNRAKLKE